MELAANTVLFCAVLQPNLQQLNIIAIMLNCFNCRTVFQRDDSVLTSFHGLTDVEFGKYLYIWSSIDSFPGWASLIFNSVEVRALFQVCSLKCFLQYFFYYLTLIPSNHRGKDKRLLSWPKISGNHGVVVTPIGPDEEWTQEATYEPSFKLTFNRFVKTN